MTIIVFIFNTFFFCEIVIAVLIVLQRKPYINEYLPLRLRIIFGYPIFHLQRHIIRIYGVLNGCLSGFIAVSAP